MTDGERDRHAASIRKTAEVFELAGHPPLKALGYAFEQEAQKLRYSQAFEIEMLKRAVGLLPRL